MTGSLPSSQPGPASDELEVSIFGPGFGECLVVHLGGNRWMVVDSCVQEGSNTSAALDYLQTLGIDPAIAVKLIVATHWHDDHVRGLSTIVERAPRARFVCSAAFGSEEFFTLVEAATTRSMMVNSGVDEFGRVLRELRRRGSRRTHDHVFALGERLIYRHRLRGIPSAEVWTLTPSDPAFQAAIAELGRLLPRSRTPKRRVAPVGPNHASVVLWIRVGRVRVLLGADLQETPGRHWTAVLSSTTRPAGRASVFKVPHHGSSNADHPPVWTALLRNEPIALVTPFVQGGVALPTPADASRICANTPNAYITADPTRPSPARREQAVERTIREVVRGMKRAVGPTGHVRVRASARATTPTMHVSTFPPAHAMCS